MADVKLISEKVLEVLRRHLPPFLSYRVNPAGCQYLPPPPAGRGLKFGRHQTKNDGFSGTVLTYHFFYYVGRKYGYNRVRFVKLH